MALKDSIAFLAAVSSSPDLRKQLSQDDVDLTAVAATVGISVGNNDLEIFKVLESVISSSSDELRQFLSLLAGDTDFQQKLNQSGCDPVLLAAERGIIIEQCEFDRLATAMQANGQVELSDEELEQVTGGLFVEAFIAPVIVTINISVGIVAVAGAVAIGAGAYAIYKASE